MFNRKSHLIVTFTQENFNESTNWGSVHALKLNKENEINLNQRKDKLPLLILVIEKDADEYEIV